MGVFINLGCGDHFVPGWINFDGSPTVKLQRNVLLGSLFRKVLSPVFPESVLYGNVVEGLPLADSSVDALYSSHMLEHLALEDFKSALREIHRVLIPGGIFRGVIPDLEELIRNYQINNDVHAAHTFMRDSLLGQESRPSNLLGRLREIFGNSRHLWMWDYDSLSAELESANFSCIERAYFATSRFSIFNEVEVKGRWDGCLGFECLKPEA